MLSIFPSILFLAPFSALLIRIALAFVLANAAWKHSYETGNMARGLAALEAITAAVVVVGASTQVAAIVGAIIIGAWLYFPSLRPVAYGTALLSLVLCLSLIVTGAGALAVDLPL